MDSSSQCQSNEWDVTRVRLLQASSHLKKPLTTLTVYSLLTRRHEILNHDTKIHVTSNADYSANDRGGSRPLMAAKTHNTASKRKNPWTKCKGAGLQRFKSTNVWRRPCSRALPKISTSVGRFLMSALHKCFKNLSFPLPYNICFPIIKSFHRL